MIERPRIEDLVRSWANKAEHDLLNIENNLVAKKIPWDTVGFHAQQCGEKYLKALLVFRRSDFPKIHDLTELYALLPNELRSDGCPCVSSLPPIIVCGDVHDDHLYEKLMVPLRSKAVRRHNV